MDIKEEKITQIIRQVLFFTMGKSMKNPILFSQYIGAASLGLGEIG